MTTHNLLPNACAECGTLSWLELFPAGRCLSCHARADERSITVGARIEWEAPHGGASDAGIVTATGITEVDGYTLGADDLPCVMVQSDHGSVWAIPVHWVTYQGKA